MCSQSHQHFSNSNKFSPNLLNQRFSTWGTRTPRGTWEAHRGYAKFWKPLKTSSFGYNFGLGGYAEGVQFWFGGTHKGYNPDLGVRKYQKVENPCFKRLFLPLQNLVSKLIYYNLPINGINLFYETKQLSETLLWQN